MSKTVRVKLTGRISGHAATTLGGWVEESDRGSVFVAPYVDQSQLTGLLVQLADLHLGFDHVAVETAAGTTSIVTADHDHHHEGVLPMTSTITRPNDADRAVDRTWRIGLAAAASAAVALLAGLCMLVADPAAGSTVEATLGFTAALSGLLTAALVFVAVVHASVNGLWSRLPINWRYVVWALLAVGIARTIWSQVSNLS